MKYIDRIFQLKRDIERILKEFLVCTSANNNKVLVD